MSTATPFARPGMIRHLAILAFAAFLSACGGGAGGGTNTVSHTVSAGAGSGGTISPASATVDDGATASFTVSPDSGYTIDTVTGCDGSLSGDTYTTGAVTADCTVSATFNLNGAITVSYTVGTSAGAGGSISPASATVNEGATASFTITPDSGYSIDTVTGCGGSLSGDTYTTDTVVTACTVSASFVALPTVSITDATVTEGDAGTTSLTFTISLSAQANGDVTVDYATNDGTATAGEDYAATNGIVTIAAATNSAAVTVTVNGDATYEPDETLTVTLSNVSANAMPGVAAATGTIYNDDAWGRLNDTGIADCSTATADDLACNDGTAGTDQYSGQDAEYGRDATANDNSDGLDGFSFTKVGGSGNPLASAAADWTCVLDNVTGLLWEVKTNDNGPHDKDWTFTWFNSNGDENGGSSGTANGGVCDDGTNCDTEKFVDRVNAAGGLCGYADWRLPTAKELVGLYHLNPIAGSGPAIDANYFPNTGAYYQPYWAANPSARTTTSAWFVNASDGAAYFNAKSNQQRVRLVRGGH